MVRRCFTQPVFFCLKHAPTERGHQAASTGPVNIKKSNTGRGDRIYAQIGMTCARGNSLYAGTIT